MINAPMAHITSNAEITKRYFEGSSQMTNCVLDLGVTCHMTLYI